LWYQREHRAPTCYRLIWQCQDRGPHSCQCRDQGVTSSQATGLTSVFTANVQEADTTRSEKVLNTGKSHSISPPPGQRGSASTMNSNFFLCLFSLETGVYFSSTFLPFC
jgi:hypothetical protein